MIWLCCVVRVHSKTTRHVDHISQHQGYLSGFRAPTSRVEERTWCTAVLRMMVSQTSPKGQMSGCGWSVTKFVRVPVSVMLCPDLMSRYHCPSFKFSQANTVVVLRFYSIPRRAIKQLSQKCVQQAALIATPTITNVVKIRHNRLVALFAGFPLQLLMTTASRQRTIAIRI